MITERIFINTSNKEDLIDKLILSEIKKDFLIIDLNIIDTFKSDLFTDFNWRHSDLPVFFCKNKDLLLEKLKIKNIDEVYKNEVKFKTLN